MFEIGLSVLGLLLVVGSLVKQDKMLSVFVFRSLFGFVLTFRLVPQEGNRKSHGKSSRLFWPELGLPLSYGFLFVRMDNPEQRGFALMLRLAFMGSSLLRVRFCMINSGKQTGPVVRNVRFWLASPGFFLSLSLFSLFSCGLPQEQALALACSTTRRCFLTPPSRRFFSPNRLAVVRFSFSSLVPALLATRDTEQVNRAHHTLHVSVLVMCSVLFFVQKMAIVPLLCGTLAAFGSNSQRFSGELLVPLSRCCC